MADKRWVSTDGDLNAAGSYSPNGVPTVNDSLYFDGTSQVDIITNLSALSAFNMTRIWFQSLYQGDGGAHGNALACKVKHLIHNGSGRLFHAYANHTQPTYVLVDSPNLIDAYTLVSGGTTQLSIYCLGGHVNLLNNTGPMNTMLVAPRRFPSDVTVEIGSGVGNVTWYRQTGGYVTTKSDLGTSSGGAIVEGGTLVYDAEGTDAWSELDITGGTVVYNGTGTLAQCVINNGTLDMTQDSRAKTITALIIMPGGIFLTHDNITITSKMDLRDSYPILP